MEPALRAATPDDLPFLRELYRSTRLEELSLTGLTGAPLDLVIDQQFKLRQLAWAQQFPHAVDRIIELEGRAIGRMLVDYRAEEGVLVDIALLPGRRSQGLGTRVVRRLLEEADAAGLTVSLHVFRESAALVFYERLGFRVIAQPVPYLHMERRPGDR